MITKKQIPKNRTGIDVIKLSKPVVLGFGIILRSLPNELPCFPKSIN